MADQENAASAPASADSAPVSLTDQHEAAHDEAQAAFDEATQPEIKKEQPVVVAQKAEGEATTEAEPAKSGDEKGDKPAAAKPVETQKPTDIFPIVETYHPGARAKAATPEFQAWLNALPKHYQDMVDRGDPVEAAMLLDMYDRDAKVRQVSEPKKTETVQTQQQQAFAPLTFDAVKDLKIMGDDGQETTIAAFAKEYGEIGNAALAIANEVVQTALKSLSQPQQTQTESYLKKTELDAFKAQMDAELFDYRVERLHSGAVKTATSDEFKAYLKQASPMQIQLFTYGGPEDVVSVINEFDRVQAVEQAKAAQRKQGDKKKALDGLHGNSLHSATMVERAKKPEATGAASPEQAAVEAREGFDAALQEIENERRRK